MGGGETVCDATHAGRVLSRKSPLTPSLAKRFDMPVAERIASVEEKRRTDNDSATTTALCLAMAQTVSRT